MIQAIKELKYWSSIENHYVDSHFLKFYCSVIQSLVHSTKYLLEQIGKQVVPQTNGLFEESYKVSS